MRRRAARLVAVGALSATLFAMLGLLAAPAALAHPLGNFTINRYTGLDLSPGRVRVTYVLDMAEIPTFQEMPRIDADRDGEASDGEKQAWGDRKARDILKHVSLAIDGKPVTLSIELDTTIFRPGQAGLPILYFKATYGGDLPAGSGSVSFRDGNYGDRIGWKEVTARSENGTHVFDSNVPAASVSDELMAYPVDLLSSPLDIREATFSFQPGAATVGSVSARGPRANGAPVASGGSFAGLVGWRLTPFVLGLSLLLAFLFGASHALGPGHGKTITAAYLVGAGARRTQALVIGGAVSLMHTASVLLLGLLAYVLSKSFPADRVYPWLTLATGLVALALGAGLMVVRVRARRRGTDHGHTHRHDHGHARHDEHVAHGDHPEVDPVSRKGLLALAVAGGILPSPTAFVVLTGAIYAHRVGYGLALILAFSVGLAAALMGVGMVALRARAIVSRRLGDGVSSLVSILSASLIVGFGMFFSARGLRAAFQPSVAVALALGVPVAALGVILARRRAPAPA